MYYLYICNESGGSVHPGNKMEETEAQSETLADLYRDDHRVKMNNTLKELKMATRQVAQCLDWIADTGDLY